MTAGAIDNAAAAKLRHVIGRVERIDEQIAGLNMDKSEVYQEAKSFGLDVKALKALVSKRRKVSKDPAAFTELEAVVELYEMALESRSSRARTRETADETPHNPETGEVLGDAPAPAESAAIATVRIGDGPEISLEDFRKAAQSINTPAGQAAADGARDPVTGIASPVEALGAIIKERHPEAATAPYRVTDPAPVPAAPDPDVSPLIADQAARQAAARRLLGQAEAAE